MARILLAMDNYQELDGYDEYFVPVEVMNRLTTGLDVTYDMENGWANVFGESHLEFTGSRVDLVTLIDRYEEDEEMRSDLYGEIVDE